MGFQQFILRFLAEVLSRIPSIEFSGFSVRIPHGIILKGFKSYSGNLSNITIWDYFKIYFPRCPTLSQDFFRSYSHDFFLMTSFSNSCTRSFSKDFELDSFRYFYGNSLQGILMVILGDKLPRKSL